MKAPAFQFYSADFLIDTQDWSIEEIGIYTRLLANQWVNIDLPTEEIRLARIAGCPLKRFRKAWPIIKKKFLFLESKSGLYFSIDDAPIGDGRLQNKRLEETRQEQEKFVESQREKGIKSAKKRWEGHITAVKPRLQPKGQPEGNSSSSSSLKEKTKDAPSPDVKTAIDHFHNETLRLKGFKPEITAKDAALVKKDLKHGIDHVKGQIDFFLRNGKSKEHITLAAAMSADTHNSYMAEISKPKMRFDNLP